MSDTSIKPDCIENPLPAFVRQAIDRTPNGQEDREMRVRLNKRLAQSTDHAPSSPSGWDEVIADAEEMLRALSQRRTALKASIAFFKKKKLDGEPLPLDLERYRI